MPFDCDVVVIGGGPAGSAAAAWLARAGRQVLLLERDRFPRFHIGESLLASVNESLEAIGAGSLVRDAGFERKWGATFITPDGASERFADFSAAVGVPQPQTWQVPRARFDELLLRHAAECGADVREQHRAIDISFEPDGVIVTSAPVPADRAADAAALRDRVPACTTTAGTPPGCKVTAHALPSPPATGEGRVSAVAVWSSVDRPAARSSADRPACARRAPAVERTYDRAEVAYTSDAA